MLNLAVMKTESLFSLIIALATLASTSPTHAVSFFTDISAWQAAASSSPTTDTLNDATNDTFPNPLFIERQAFGYRVLGAVILDTPSGGIDTIWDVNGTSYFQNNVRAGFPPDVVTFQFDQAISAFAFDVRSAGLNSFSSRIDIVTNDGQTGFFNLPAVPGSEFRGITFPTAITALELRAVGSPFATHGADNIRFVPVPEPQTYATVFGILLLVAALAKRNRAQTVPTQGNFEG